MSLPPDSKARRRLGLLFAVPLAFSLLFFLVSTSSERNDVQLLQSQQLYSAVGKLRSVANDAEVGEHGFLLTGDERYLANLRSASARIGIYTDNLRRFDPDGKMGPLWQHAVDLVNQRVAKADRVVKLEQSDGLSAAIALAKSDGAQELMAQIRAEIESLQNQFGKETGRLLDKENRLTRLAFCLFIVGTAVMLLVLLWLYHSVINHIQARDNAHAELELLNAELEMRIDERTTELRQFNEELQQFAYVASHDLQEPLRTIVSFTQLLARRYKGRLDDDADEFIDYIVGSARRMTDLINGLLALVRLRKQGQGMVPVDFEQLAREAEKSLQAAIRESDATIECGAMPSLVVEPIQFTQVIQNLIANSIKYRSERQPWVKIQARRDESNWIFSVADNGRGFDQQFADRIFGLFQRLHGREVEGTGMGLTIAKRVVERHGGRMWAEGSEGSGATFYFSLPVSLEARDPASENAGFKAASAANKAH